MNSKQGLSMWEVRSYLGDWLFQKERGLGGKERRSEEDLMREKVGNLAGSCRNSACGDRREVWRRENVGC